jgi:pilus assembly protein CpaE
MKRLLIIAPDEKLPQHLGQAFAAMKSKGTATVVREYPSLGALAKLVHLKRPEAMIMSLEDPVRAVELIRTLTRSYPTLPVIAAHTVNESDLILEAVRAGAAEYLGPPFEPENVARVLDAPPCPRVTPASGGRLLAFVPARAGSGASAAAVHTAAAMAELSGKRVLVVDYDFHAGALDFWLRLKPGYSVSHALSRCLELEDVWAQIPAHWHGIDVLAAPRLGEPKPQVSEAGVLFRFLKYKYDWAIADFPPALFQSCQDVLAETSAVYLVSTTELVSLHLARRRAQELFDAGVPRENIQLIVSRAGGKDACSAEDAARLVGLPVAWSLPNDYRTLAAAYHAGKLVPPTSELGREYSRLARQILGISTPEKQKRRWRVNVKAVLSTP